MRLRGRATPIARDRGRLLARGLLLLGLCAIACSDTRGDMAGDDHDRALRGGVVILLDTVRADHVSAYGYGRRTTPSLESLAARGVLFEQAISSAPWTLPSAASILSGRWVEHALIARGREIRLRQSLAEDFQEAGFETAAFTEGGFVSQHFGFDRGFATYVEEEGPVRLGAPGEAPPLASTGSVARTFARARRWIREHAGERFLVLIHTYEPHTPYTRTVFSAGLDPGGLGSTFGPGERARMRRGELELGAVELRYLEALYDGGIFEADRHVGQLLDLLEELGLSRSTVVVVTSDHGEELGAHYPEQVADHGHSLHDDLLRVPLILSNPADSQRGRRVRSQVRTVDILPTLADLLGVELRSPTDGESLVAMMRGDEGLARIAYSGATKVGPQRASVRFLGYKYIEVVSWAQPRPLHPGPPRSQLYDLERDPGETTNLAGSRSPLQGRLAELLRQGRAGAGDGAVAPSPDQLPSELRERLRSLGYVD